MFLRRLLWPLSTLLVGAVVVIGLYWTVNRSDAGDTGGAGPAANGKAKLPALPIKQVVLFNCGVGYFQREGEVDGDGRVELTFPASEVNELLKSLVLHDPKGKVGAVSYDSQDPAQKTLRSFAIDLNNNPTLSQILNQARGEKIEITRGDSKEKTSGTIIGMEAQNKSTEKGAVVEVELLNLLTSAGLQSMPLAQVSAVRFMNPTLDSEFQRALAVLAISHDAQKKTVSVDFHGNGKRQVKLGYVVDRPIWKTTYRLRMEPNGKIAMQGWAIVENTSDDDWTDVRMVLVSGRPISFKMNLYDPLYVPRPVVEPELFASLRPPVYDGSIRAEGVDAAQQQQLRAAALAQQAAQDQLQRRAGGMVGGFGGQFGGQFGGGFAGQIGGQFGGQVGGENYAFAPGFNGGASFNGGPSNRFQTPPSNNFVENTTQQKLTYEQMQARRAEQREKRIEAQMAGESITGFNFREGIASVADAEEIGDYFQYVIDRKTSIARQKSAMLPIIDQSIEGHKVSIFNESIHAKYPLLGLRLKNSSEKPLTQGPITVYDEGTYAGDTRILDLQPNEERLLSYAIDQAVEVKVDARQTISPHLHFQVGGEHLTSRFNVRQTRAYVVRNRAASDRVVVIEHPMRAGWKLIEPTKAHEETRELYRFQLKVPAGQTASLEVAEEKPHVDNVALKSEAAAPYYPIIAGVNAKVVTTVAPDKLQSLRIVQGFVQPTLKSRKTTSYYVQNLSTIARTFSIDHVTPAEWTRVDKGKEIAGPATRRDKLEVEVGKVAQFDVVEERTHRENQVWLYNLPIDVVRRYQNDEATSTKVKDALERTLKMRERNAVTKLGLAAVQRRLDLVMQDQARLRANLQIIPTTSEPYKKFLEKFVSQETEIENLQQQVRETTATVQTQDREMDALLAAMNED